MGRLGCIVTFLLSQNVEPEMACEEFLWPWDDERTASDNGTIMMGNVLIVQCNSSLLSLSNVNKQLFTFLQVSRDFCFHQLFVLRWFQFVQPGDSFFGITFLLYYISQIEKVQSSSENGDNRHLARGRYVLHSLLPALRCGGASQRCAARG